MCTAVYAVRRRMYVRIASHMLPPFDNEHSLFQPFGVLLGEHSTRQAGANDDHIIVIKIDSRGGPVATLSKARCRITNDVEVIIALITTGCFVAVSIAVMVNS